MKFQTFLAASVLSCGVSGDATRQLRVERELATVQLGQSCYDEPTWYWWWGVSHDCAVGSCIDKYCKRETGTNFNKNLLEDYIKLAIWIYDEEGGDRPHEDEGVPENYERLAGHPGYAIFATPDGECHVVYRATFTTEDIATDFQSQFQGRSDPTGTGIFVNNAFWDHYQEMAAEMEQDIEQAKGTGKCTKNWSFFGHSLGGAIVDMAVVSLAHSQGRPLHGKIGSVIRAGNPRSFGDSGSTCTKFNSLANGNVERYARVVSDSRYKDFDAVTAVPFTYHHCSKESYLLFSSDAQGRDNIHVEADVGSDIPNDDHNLIEDFLQWIGTIIFNQDSFHNPQGYLHIAQNGKVYTKKA